MKRSFAFRLAFFVSVTLLSVTSAQAGALPDIRGLSFTSPIQAAEFLEGTIPGFGLVTQPLIGPAQIYPLDPFPHTFDVRADPSALNDPSRIVIDTRLVTVDGPGQPLVFIPLTLFGTYDLTTGAITASGTSIGTFLNNGGADPFGIAPGTNVFLQVTNPSETIHAVVSVSGAGITITGTDPAVAPGSPGNITADAANLLFIPGGSINPADAVLTLPVLDPGGAIFNLTATSAVPEPSTMAAAVLGGLTLLTLVRRRRSA